MKLLISVVNSDDAHPLIDALMSEGYRATMISTTGGFLREGNATLLIGVADENVKDVLKIVKESCHTRTQWVNPLPPTVESGELYMPTPIEVPVGGAVVFIMNVERSNRARPRIVSVTGFWVGPPFSEDAAGGSSLRIRAGKPR